MPAVSKAGNQVTWNHFLFDGENPHCGHFTSREIPSDEEMG
jgi:hypothetical protein